MRPSGVHIPTAKKKKTTGSQLTHPKKTAKRTPTAKAPKKLISHLREMIDDSRQVISETVNAALVVLYWNIGKRV
jgi:hypothetical protein